MKAREQIMQLEDLSFQRVFFLKNKSETVSVYLYSNSSPQTISSECGGDRLKAKVWIAKAIWHCYEKSS